MQTNANHLWQLPANWVIAAPISLMQIQLQVLIERFLSDEELSRARRFRQQEDQQRYLLAHGLKRLTLSKILNVEPFLLSFNVAEKGKPGCDCSGNIGFNLSHSGDWVLCGVSSVADIGVDVEIANRDVSDAVASYSLTSGQLVEVRQSADPSERLMLYWTQKEAISKALGLGLSIGFKSLECSGMAGNSVVHHSGHELTLNSRLFENYVVSAATTGIDQPLFYRLKDWSESELLIDQL
ncbi:MAG: 4'-phosphopantetheinyl transferase [Cellvibrionaceae bacterium]|jgi:4'-phosphopantetheinyl transferase